MAGAPEFEIAREVELAATPEHVWEAITTRQGIAGWFADMDPTPEAFRTAWDPPRLSLGGLRSLANPRREGASSFRVTSGDRRRGERRGP